MKKLGCALLLIALVLLWLIVRPSEKPKLSSRVEAFSAPARAGYGAAAVKDLSFLKPDFSSEAKPPSGVRIENKRNEAQFKATLIRNASGQAILMDQVEGRRRCEQLGLRMPTALELASLTKAWGGEEAGEGARIVARNQDSSVDDFVFHGLGASIPMELQSAGFTQILTASVNADPERVSKVPCVLSLSRNLDGLTYWLLRVLRS